MTSLENEVYVLKDIIDSHLPKEDGFESYMFSVGSYNDSVGADFQLPLSRDAVGVLIISTPAMFDVSFKRWFQDKVSELGSLENVAEDVTSPIQEFMADRLASVVRVLPVRFEILHDHSLWPSRKPKLLMQTCGHVSGAAYYYQPKDVICEGWPPERPMDARSKFIGLSLHPVYGGHFAFRSAFLFPDVKIPSMFKSMKPQSILGSDSEIREALEKFNFSWRDSGFRDFGGPQQRYSRIQMEFFGKPPSDRWEVLREWC